MQVRKQKKDYIAAIPYYNCDLGRIQTPNLLIDSQWLGVKDAPKQQSLFFESSFENQKINFGALIRNRSRFAENSTQLFIQFAFPIQLTNDSYLHLGVQAGGDFYELNFEYLSSVDGVVKGSLVTKTTAFYS